MEYDPTRMCELLVGLGDVEVLSVDDEGGGPLRVHVRCRAARPPCGGCGCGCRKLGRGWCALCFARSACLISDGCGLTNLVLDGREHAE